MRIHALKIRVDFFNDVISGKKTFEIRNNDRAFQVGDQLSMVCVTREGQYPLDEHGERQYISKKITYILSGSQWGIMDNYVVLGLGEIEE